MSANPSFGDREFVAGSFKSVRVFEVGWNETAERPDLFPVSQHTLNYSQGGVWYTASCNAASFDGDKVARYVVINYPGWTISRASLIERLNFLTGINDRIIVLDLQYIQGTLYGHIELPAKDFMPSEPCVSPRLGCSCGFYSFYTLQHLNQSTGYWFYNTYNSYVVAIVENAGRVLHGTLGMRSQRMKILGISFVEVPAPLSYVTSTFAVREEKGQQLIMNTGTTSRTYAELVMGLSKRFPIFNLTELFDHFNLDARPE